MRLIEESPTFDNEKEIVAHIQISLCNKRKETVHKFEGYFNLNNEELYLTKKTHKEMLEKLSQDNTVRPYISYEEYNKECFDLLSIRGDKINISEKFKEEIKEIFSEKLNCTAKIQKKINVEAKILTTLKEFYEDLKDIKSLYIVNTDNGTFISKDIKLNAFTGEISYKYFPEPGEEVVSEEVHFSIGKRNITLDVNPKISYASVDAQEYLLSMIDLISSGVSKHYIDIQQNQLKDTLKSPFNQFTNVSEMLLKEYPIAHYKIVNGMVYSQVVSLNLLSGEINFDNPQKQKTKNLSVWTEDRDFIKFQINEKDYEITLSNKEISTEVRKELQTVAKEQIKKNLKESILNNQLETFEAQNVLENIMKKPKL